MNKPHCPQRYGRPEGPDGCDLDDCICLLESGLVCDLYNEWLEEISIEDN